MCFFLVFYLYSCLYRLIRISFKPKLAPWSTMVQEIPCLLGAKLSLESLSIKPPETYHSEQLHKILLFPLKNAFEFAVWKISTVFLLLLSFSDFKVLCVYTLVYNILM